MSGIMIAKERLENRGSGTGAVFPEGSFIGTIEKTVVRDFPEFIGKNVAEGRNSGYTSGAGSILSVWLSDNVPLEGAASPGKQRMFVDFVIQDGDATISDGEAIPGTSWQMKRDEELASLLAVALGAVEEVEMNGKPYLVTADNFIDALTNGDFNGAKVGFRTYHREWTSKAGKSGVEVRVPEFFAAE